MATKTFNISMDEALVNKIDKAAKAQYSSRSDFLRMAAIKSLDSQYATNGEALKAAHKILKIYKKDFQNLAKR